MITYRGISRSNDQVDCSGQRAVVAGGTGGIGSGIALRYALCGANVWIIGRNTSRGEAILDQLRLASAEGHRRRNPSAESPDSSTNSNPHLFFSADLSKVEDTKRVAQEISSKAGKNGIDYLIETQGGPPTGRFQPPASPSSPEGGFAVQCGSRFGLAHILTSRGIIKRGICMVASPGNGSSLPIDPNDLDLRRAEEVGQFKQGIHGILPMGQRQSSVLDAVTQTLAERNPSLAITHLFPGVVGTDAAATAGFPAPFIWASKALTWLGVFSSPTIGSYPEVPFYLHSNPEGVQYLRLGQSNLLGPYLGRKDLSTNVQAKSVREEIYARLEKMYA